MDCLLCRQDLKHDAHRLAQRAMSPVPRKGLPVAQGSLGMEPAPKELFRHP